MGPDWSRIFVEGLGRSSLRHHTAHLTLTNTRVVGVPPLVIPLFGFPYLFWPLQYFPQEQPDGELGNKIFTINDNKFVKIRSIGPEGT